MENLQRIALLIDADNTQLAKLEDVIQEISTHGRIVVKRAYGNWRKDTLKNWENELKRLAIKAEQQFDYVSGKNTTCLLYTSWLSNDPGRKQVQRCMITKLKN